MPRKFRKYKLLYALIFLFTLIIIIGLAFSCTKVDKTPHPVPMYYDYYPLNENLVRYYEVDSTGWFNSKSHAHYFMKVQFSRKITDASGNNQYIYTRFRRLDSNSNWKIIDEVAMYMNNNQAMYQEGNISYVKLIFPVTTNGNPTWDANKYNLTDSTHYYNAKYTGVHVPYSINGLSFDSTANVEYENNTDIISTNKYTERYATNVGLINASRTELEVQPGNNPPATNDTAGYAYTIKLTAYTK